MTDKNIDETVSSTTRARKGFDVNWTRLEGVVGVSALLTSFMWFLGMPIGMAIGVGFGIVFLLDFIRQLIFRPSRTGQSDLDTPEMARQ